MGCSFADALSYSDFVHEDPRLSASARMPGRQRPGVLRAHLQAPSGSRVTSSGRSSGAIRSDRREGVGGQWSPDWMPATTANGAERTDAQATATC
jgi:hypothetical protein